MSAIAGIVALDGGVVDPDSLRPMIESLAHRGHAIASTLSDRSATLVRFDHARGREPIGPVHLSETLLLAADARIDNREEFPRENRSSQGSRSDEMLIGEIWSRSGRDGIARIAGDFSMALWDSRARQLVLARDHFGVRPLYYHATPARIFFATELRGLLALPEVPATIDESMIAGYLGSLPRAADSTFYQEIRRLPPAHLLKAGPGGVQVERYWSLDPRREVRYASQTEYDEAFREQFIAAVACRFDGAASTGSMLSGGLDSSAISAVARRLAAEGGGKLQTFSIVFPTYPRCDESEWIEALVGQGDITPTYIEGDRIAPMGGLGETLEHLDEPLAGANLFLHEAMYRRARAVGLDSILDGLDGDTTVSHGVAYLAELAAAGRFSTLWNEATEISRHNGTARGKILWNRGLKPLIPGVLRGLQGQLRRRRPVPGDIVPDPEFARRTRYHELMRENFGRNLTAPLDAREHHYRKLTAAVIPEVLEIADISSGRNGIEPRYPFFDRRLAELCLGFPGDQKLQGGWTRFILRNALGGILPEKIRWRPLKADLGFNFIPSLLRMEGEAIGEIVRSPGELAGYIEPASLGSAYSRFSAQPSNADAMLLWKTLALDRWLKRRSGLRGEI